MCVVSMVMDYGRQHEPWTSPVPQAPGFYPYVPAVLPDPVAREAIIKFIELVEAAKKFDAASGQPNCEDPNKIKFEAEVLGRLAEIEKRLEAA